MTPEQKHPRKPALAFWRFLPASRNRDHEGYLICTINKAYSRSEVNKAERLSTFLLLKEGRSSPPKTCISPPSVEEEEDRLTIELANFLHWL